MRAPGTQMLEGLRLLEDMPGWLRQDRLERAMRKCVPEFTSGTMTLLAARAKVILEQGMRAGSSALADIRIECCVPSVARSKRNRCTVVYRLEYGPEAAGRDWPQVVVAKTHRGDKGRAAYRAMCALWGSSLRWNGAVTIAEPLGFLPELNVLIQRAVPGETTLGDRIECMLLRDPGEHGDRENIIELLGKTARGLSALHRCGLHGPPFGWDEEMAEVREMMGRLSRWVPGLEAQLAPALDGLEEFSIRHPPKVSVPSHRSF